MLSLIKYSVLVLLFSLISFVLIKNPGYIYIEWLNYKVYTQMPVILVLSVVMFFVTFFMMKIYNLIFRSRALYVQNKRIRRILEVFSDKIIDENETQALLKLPKGNLRLISSFVKGVHYHNKGNMVAAKKIFADITNTKIGQIALVRLAKIACAQGEDCFPYLDSCLSRFKYSPALEALVNHAFDTKQSTKATLCLKHIKRLKSTDKTLISKALYLKALDLQERDFVDMFKLLKAHPFAHKAISKVLKSSEFVAREPKLSLKLAQIYLVQKVSLDSVQNYLNVNQKETPEKILSGIDSILSNAEVKTKMLAKALACIYLGKYLEASDYMYQAGEERSNPVKHLLFASQEEYKRAYEALLPYNKQDD